MSKISSLKSTILSKKIFILLPVVVSLFVLVSQVKAQTTPTPSSTCPPGQVMSNGGFCINETAANAATTACEYLPGCSTAKEAVEIIKDVAPSADTVACFAGGLANPVSGTVCLAGQFLESVMPWVATAFDGALYLDNFIPKPDIIKSLWTFIRNFVNLFFILILLVIAFATIFDNQRYGWQSLLARLVIVALLINFSFVIVTTVHSVSNIISGIFLRTISESSNNATVSANLMNGFGLQADATGGWLDTVSKFSLETIKTATGVNLIRNIIKVFMLGLVFFTFLTLLIMLIIRVFVIWALIITAPLAFMAYILPSTKQHYDNWQKHLISWTFFMPVYMFFLAITFVFINNKSQILATLSPFTGGTALVFEMLDLNQIIFYLLTLAILWFGLKAAHSFGSFSSTGVTAAFDKIQGGIKHATYNWTGVKPRYEGIKEGLGAKKAELQERGILGGRFGAQRSRETQARWSDAFGLGATKGGQDRAIADNISKERKRFEDMHPNYRRADVDTFLSKARNRNELVAALELKAENGWLDATDVPRINEAMRALGGGRTAAGSKLLQSLLKGKFNRVALGTADKEAVFSALADAETKKAFGLLMAENGEVTNTTLAEEILNLHVNDSIEKVRKVEEEMKKNIEKMARQTQDREDMVNGTGVFTGVDSRLSKLAGQVMSEKKEVISWGLKNRIITLNGGMDPVTGEALTADGRKLAFDMTKESTMLQEEGKYRKDNAIAPTAVLTPTDRASLEAQVVTNISSGLVRNLSPNDMKAPEIANAIYELQTTTGINPAMAKQLIGQKADRKTREAFEKAKTNPLSIIPGTPPGTPPAKIPY